MPFTLDIMSLSVGAALGAAGVYAWLLKKTAKLEADNKVLTEKNLQQAEAVGALEKKFALQFENLANKIFDEKTNKFKKESQDGIAQLLNPLRERLQEFQKKVDDSFSTQAKEQFSLKNEIKNIVEMNEKMKVQTESLTKALKGDVKVQGNWGEIMLEKILEDSGLRKNEDYKLQGASLDLRHAEDGTRLKPDAVVFLPDSKHIIIDAKVSLNAYERFCAATDEAQRAIELKSFTAAVRARVQELEVRRYQDTEKLGTPDFVLMFMPIEGAYALAVQQDQQLHSFAWDKKVVIVCPATLFATLKTINSVWRIELQNKNALEIARQGSGLYDKVVGFVEDMQDIGIRIGAAQKSYDDAFKKLSTGTGNIIKRAEDLKALGVKASKKMPKGLADEDDSALKIAENS